MVCSVKEVCLALKEARTKGGIPLSGVMRERRASRCRILNEARGKLLVRCQEHESARRARASVWLSSAVKQERRWCREWDAVMSEVPVGLERVKAFLGGEWTCVDKGHRTSSAPEPAPTDVQAHSCFSAFLEANEDEEEDDVVPDHPTVAVGNGASAPVEHGFAFAVQTMANAVGASSVDVDVSGVDDILRAHGSEGLETKIPDGLRHFPPGRGNSGAAAVCDVLDAIGTGSPGWSRCGASKARGRFAPVAGPAWSGRRRQREARSALDTFRESLRAKSKCLAEHAKAGGHSQTMQNSPYRNRCFG